MFVENVFGEVPPKEVATLAPDQARLFKDLSDWSDKAILCRVLVQTQFAWARGGFAGTGDMAADLRDYGQRLVPENNDVLHRMLIEARSHTVMGWPKGRCPCAYQALFNAADYLYDQIKGLLELRDIKPIYVDGAWRPTSEPWSESELIEAIETHADKLRWHLLTLPSPDMALEEWDGEFEFEYYRVLYRILPTAKFETGRPDEKADGSMEKFVRFPRNPDVIRLARAIRSPKNRGRPMIDIALEIAENNEIRAESLMRKLRDFRHLREP